MNPENPTQPAQPMPPQPTPVFQAPTPTPPPTPLTSNVAPISAHETPKPKTNFGTVILALIVLIALGALGFWYQKYYASKSGSTQVSSPTPSSVVPTATPDVTANWKTYTNNQWGFSIKYPAEATFFAAQKPYYDIKFIGPVQTASGKTQTSLTDGYDVNVAVAKLAPTSTLNSLATYFHDHALNSCPNPQIATISPLANITLDSAPAMSYTLTNCAGNYKVTIVVANGQEYDITELYASSDPQTLINYQNTADQIVSTFKILSLSSPTPSVSWKTYTGTGTLAFSINYPSDWTLTSTSDNTGGKGVILTGNGQKNTIGIGWDNKFTPGPCSGTLVNVQLKNKSVQMCHTQGSTQEPENYSYSSTINGSIYSISASNYTGDTAGRDLNLQILATLSI